MNDQQQKFTAETVGVPGAWRVNLRTENAQEHSVEGFQTEDAARQWVKHQAEHWLASFKVK